MLAFDDLPSYPVYNDHYDDDDDSSPNNIHHRPSTPPSNQKQHFAFWLMGILNNSAYVVMIAGAKNISEGGTGLVFIMNTLPSLCVKLSAPYWFHLVEYQVRIYMAAIFFSLSFCTVAFYADVTPEERLAPDYDFWHVEEMELVGVALSSLGGGLGEASLLALAGKYDSGKKGVNLTAFSSGTGLAGVFGFLWVALFHDWLQLSFTQTLLLANVLALAYGVTYYKLLSKEEDYQREDGAGNMQRLSTIEDSEHSSNIDEDENDELELIKKEAQKEQLSFSFKQNNSKTALMSNERGYKGLAATDDDDDDDHYDEDNVNNRNKNSNNSTESDDDYLFDEDALVESGGGRKSSSAKMPLDQLDVNNISFRDRLRLVGSLWPYMVPLFTVYFAEYALQSGAWTAIGFPVDDVQARSKFYENGNWLYQLGVFVSRSSGTVFQASLLTLWILPGLQIVNLIFFVWTAVTHVWYDWSLLLPCFGAGLLGGGVYVNAYTRINADLPPHQKEFALASASVADSFGIVLADITGLYIQSCIYRANKISGAAVTCPLN